MATPQEILEKLKSIPYPGYSRDIVSFGIVRDIEVASAGITVVLAPGGARPEAVEEIRRAVFERVRAVTGVENVEIVVEHEPQPAKHVQRSVLPEVPGIRHIIAVASGKGGVGKSTVAVNLALALAAEGERVGLVDADVYGPSVPLMLGILDRPAADESGQIVPPQRYGIKAISMGLFVQDRTPVIWRGPLLTKLLTQFLRDVDWGELDYLVIDLPPGTGDAQLTIVQQVRLDGGVIVTTPQDVALLDVQRGIEMFRQVNAPVLGVIENMSYYVCPDCGERSEIFGHGGGARMAEQHGVPLLAELPLVPAIGKGSDLGEPVVVAAPDGPESKTFREIARQVQAAVKRAAVASPIVR
jgi:ATP-binding protein involved in chromosome partitioning